MRKTGETRLRQGIRRGILTLALILLIGLSADDLRIVSHAQSQGRVTSTTSVNIRKEPNTTSEVLGAALPGREITITSQVTGDDGKTWYQTFVNSDTLGYVRSDFVEIIDGSTPATVTPVTPSTPNTTTPSTTTPSTTPVGDVEVLNPVSATVKGGSNVRIRSGASTSSDIVKRVANGLVLTVTGRATDSAGDTWYKVSFSDNGSEIEGFIRYDFLTITEELTPYVPEPETPETPPTEPETPETPPAVTKDFDTEFSDGVWYLLDYGKNTKTSIDELYEKLNGNAALYQEEHKKAESQKVVIIILVFLLVAAISGIAMLVFKIRDMSDDAYFNRVERETLRKRGEKRQNQEGSQRVMHTVGSEKPSRPVSGRPSGSQGGQQSQRPQGGQQGQRPQGGQQGQRPQGGQQGQRPQGGQLGQRPQGSQQSQRPQGGQQSQRPQGGQQSQRPQGGQQSQRPQGSQQGQRPRGSQQGQRPQGWQSKNFMSEEDEFEFEFLNYDGNEQK